ncbi:hypothetical protein JCM5353_002387 [Sporobolomyces roseus]
MSSIPLRPDSSSSPASSLPFRPFSSLPTEIIQHIIYSTFSSRYHPNTYVERQLTLHSLCLVSRLFFDLAKPHLYAVVRLTRREKVEAFRDTEQDRAKKIETFELVLDGQGLPKEANNLYPLLAMTFSLRTLKLDDFTYKVDLKHLSRLKNLSTLHILESSIWTSAPFLFPLLQELYLEDARLDVLWEQIFSPMTVPDLRVLVLNNSDAAVDDITPLLRELGDQLEILWIDSDYRTRLAADVFEKINRKTLFDEDCSVGVTLPTVHAYRLWDDPVCAFDVPTLEELEEIVRRSTNPLPTVLYLAGCHSSDPHDPSLEAPRQRFREADERRKGEDLSEMGGSLGRKG